MTAQDSETVGSVLDHWIDRDVRERLERMLLEPIEVMARVENFATDPVFLANPHDHVALFPDHGRVHSRDIASIVIELLASTNGVLIPARSQERLESMIGLGVLLAFVHDMGMVDCTPYGRWVHAYYASQFVFTEAFDDLAASLWANDAGRLRSWTTAHGVGSELMLRSLLGLAAAHSKSRIPIEMLGDRRALRERFRYIMETPLETIYQAETGRPAPRPAGPAPADRLTAAERASLYSWLTDECGDGSFVDDVLETLRFFRAADALRQRGASYRTSAGYEAFADRVNGKAIYALRSIDQDAVAYLEVDSAVCAGEANLRDVTLDGDGHLSISFDRSWFSQPNATDDAAGYAAVVVADIALDVLGAFDAVLPYTSAVGRRSVDGSMEVRLARPFDHPEFADLVAARVREVHSLAHRVRVGLDTASLPPAERALVASARSLDATTRDQTTTALGLDGPDDARTLLDELLVATVEPGTKLVEIGSLSDLVLLPLGPGLVVEPAGGFDPRPAAPMVPLGATALVRGSGRNARIVAVERVEVVVIPGRVWFAACYEPIDEHTVGELAGRFGPAATRVP